MGYYQEITKEGRDFITNICTSNGERNNDNDKLQGNKYSYQNPVLIKTALSWSIPPYNDPNYIYISHAQTGIFGTNGRQSITTNLQLAGEVIKWFNYYCKLYDVNTNVVSAIPYNESKYNIWVFNDVSTAVGIGQFIAKTAWDIMLVNQYSTPVPFYPKEIAALTKNFYKPFPEYIKHGIDKTAYQACINDDGVEGRTNRTMLYQNMIDNPDLCIKGMANLMLYSAKFCNRIAASSLSCYFQGAGFAANTYVDTLNNINRKLGSNKLQEVQKYNSNIFNVLKTGYKLPELQDVVATTPDPSTVQKITNKNG